ncbi:ACP S-malonyltransferase [Caloranaerobacter azorensis]|uniref:Malonyl CoA-acyl carrier protein transacylase n=1 Tax=Caloranaerobacter azorensis TaxID=116090 RepID=A0A6P1YA47_9FIRM|nr:ACP S-malonyltransferase [Caloranaerobacter azorensis]QIB26230.1 ACP S-malonyltransferase [Caloranaerobacter azorensis]
MNKIAFIFPGQGAQYVGMGMDIVENYRAAAEVFDIANESLGFDLKRLCFEGPNEELIKTENTQPAILTTSIAILKVIDELGLKAEITAGLSLGEYSSLVYSGAFKFEEAVKLVKVRGKLMQETVPFGVGTMAAIIGLERDVVEEVVRESSDVGVVECANYNCPGQIVISGEVKAVEKACDIAKEKGAKKALKLSVSAPFHSSLLRPAGDKLNEELKKVSIAEMKTKVVSNVTAKIIENESEIRELLSKQVFMPVLWQDSIEFMIKYGIDTFIEIGPGKSLSSFVKKTAKKLGVKVTTINVENMTTLSKLKEFLS